MKHIGRDILCGSKCECNMSQSLVARRIALHDGLLLHACLGCQMHLTAVVLENIVLMVKVMTMGRSPAVMGTVPRRNTVSAIAVAV